MLRDHDKDREPISIHALREEGDLTHDRTVQRNLQFLSTPSARRATCPKCPKCPICPFLSTPSARRATKGGGMMSTGLLFLSTPSARRATSGKTYRSHAAVNFYPRPPRGGRHICCPRKGGKENFYPRPPRGGRLAAGKVERVDFFISIHALREEGDLEPFMLSPKFKIFLSTPSARRATRGGMQMLERLKISIHALREEGDSHTAMG